MFSPTLPSWPYENQLVSATSFSQISSSRASLWASAQVRNRSCPMDKNMVLEARMVGTWCHQKLMFDDFSWRFLHGLKAKTSYSWKFMPSRLPASQTFRGLSQPISHRGLSIASHDEPSRLAVLTCGKKPWVVVGSGYWTSGWYTVYRYIYIHAGTCMYTWWRKIRKIILTTISTLKALSIFSSCATCQPIFLTRATNLHNRRASFSVPKSAGCPITYW